MSTSQFLLHQNTSDNIHIDVHPEEDTIWLTQDQMATLIGKAISTMNVHIKKVFSAGELDEEVAVFKFRIATRHGAIPEKTQDIMRQTENEMTI